MEYNLRDEFQYFIEHQEELVKKYLKKYVVIKDQQVIEVYDSELEAYFASKEKYGLGKFIIQQCLPGIESYTQTFNSRAIFA